MNERVKLVEESIRHYDRLAYGVNGPDEHIFSGSCPLCEVFTAGQFVRKCMDRNGEACPIMSFSSFAQCRNTPWYDMFYFVNISKPLRVNKQQPEFLDALEREIDFLYKVLEREKMLAGLKDG